ncbi:hypothetical protein U1Q18_036331, partial [Sarracenia purpurea var. burkii]
EVSSKIGLAHRGTVGIWTAMAAPEKDDRRSLHRRNAMYYFEFDDFTGKDVDMNRPREGRKRAGALMKTTQLERQRHH